jgi:hypothetical protein
LMIDPYADPVQTWAKQKWRKQMDLMTNW